MSNTEEIISILRNRLPELVAVYRFGSIASGTARPDSDIEPAIEIAQNYGLSDRDLRVVKALIEEHEHGIRSAWQQHFGR
ncbi:MAG: nucleotidyltransferase domain-containing protein [Burkholderiales bacterium]